MQQRKSKRKRIPAKKIIPDVSTKARKLRIAEEEKAKTAEAQRLKKEQDELAATKKSEDEEKAKTAEAQRLKKEQDELAATKISEDKEKAKTAEAQRLKKEQDELAATKICEDKALTTTTTTTTTTTNANTNTINNPNSDLFDYDDSIAADDSMHVDNDDVVDVDNSGGSPSSSNRYSRSDSTFAVKFTAFNYPDNSLGVKIIFNSFGNIQVSDRGEKVIPSITNGLYIIKNGDNDVPITKTEYRFKRFIKNFKFSVTNNIPITFSSKPLYLADVTPTMLQGIDTLDFVLVAAELQHLKVVCYNQSYAIQKRPEHVLKAKIVFKAKKILFIKSINSISICSEGFTWQNAMEIEGELNFECVYLPETITNGRVIGSLSNSVYERIETYPNADQAVVTHGGIRIERSEKIDVTEKEQENFKKIPFCYFHNDRGNFLIKPRNAANYWGIAYRSKCKYCNVVIGPSSTMMKPYRLRRHLEQPSCTVPETILNIVLNNAGEVVKDTKQKKKQGGRQQKLQFTDLKTAQTKAKADYYDDLKILLYNMNPPNQMLSPIYLRTFKNRHPSLRKRNSRSSVFALPTTSQAVKSHIMTVAKEESKKARARIRAESGAALVGTDDGKIPTTNKKMRFFVIKTRNYISSVCVDHVDGLSLKALVVKAVNNILQAEKDFATKILFLAVDNAERNFATDVIKILTLGYKGSSLTENDDSLNYLIGDRVPRLVVRDSSHTFDLIAKDFSSIPEIKNEIIPIIKKVGAFAANAKVMQKFEELLNAGKINQVPKKPYNGSDTRFHLFVDSVVSLQNTPTVIRKLFSENINNYLSWYDSVKKNLPYKDIQKYIHPCQWKIIDVIKKFMNSIRSAIQVTSNDSTPMTIMVVLAKATTDDCFALLNNNNFVEPLKYMFEGDNNQNKNVTAFTKDIINMIKVRCNFGSDFPCNTSETNPNGCGLIPPRNAQFNKDSRKVGLLDEYHFYCYFIDPHRFIFKNNYFAPYQISHLINAIVAWALPPLCEANNINKQNLLLAQQRLLQQQLCDFNAQNGIFSGAWNYTDVRNTSIPVVGDKATLNDIIQYNKKFTWEAKWAFWEKFPSTLIYKLVAKPLLSCGTSGSMICERTIKKYKKKLLEAHRTSSSHDLSSAELSAAIDIAENLKFDLKQEALALVNAVPQDVYDLI